MGNLIITGLRVNRKIIKRIDEIAEEEELTRSDIFRRACREYIERRDDGG